MHVIGHALGLYHQTQLSYAGSYVDVKYDNIELGDEANFMSIINIKRNDWNRYPVNYDFGSVMQQPAFVSIQSCALQH